MKQITLNATIRTEIGHSVKHLRSSGIIPITMYTKATDSVSMSVPVKELTEVLKKAGETGLISLTAGGQTHPVLVQKVQLHPVDDAVLHVEFHKVNLLEKVTARIPVVIEGESPAIINKLGNLLTLIHEIEVEALPTELPEHILVDIQILTAVNQEICVKDLQIPKGVTVLTNGEVGVVRIAEPTKVEVEPIVVAPTEEAITEEKTADTDKKEADTTDAA